MDEADNSITCHTSKDKYIILHEVVYAMNI
jgi:hypothetical protein